MEIVGVSCYLEPHRFIVGQTELNLYITLKTPDSAYETSIRSDICFEQYDENGEFVQSFGFTFPVIKPNSYVTYKTEFSSYYDYTFVPSPEWSHLVFVPVGKQDSFGNLI